MAVVGVAAVVVVVVVLVVAAVAAVVVVVVVVCCPCHESAVTVSILYFFWQSLKHRDTLFRTGADIVFMMPSIVG